MTAACVLSRSGPGSEKERVDDRYRLITVIGQGRTGRIWLAEDELLLRTVTVEEFATEAAAREALDVRLHDPAAAKIFNAIPWDGRWWVVMEYVAAEPAIGIARPPATAARGVARAAGARLPAPPATRLNWRGCAAVPAPTSRNRFDR
ncbi:hypothetical protein ACIA5D_30255 [Actinoplanes sp. NPDC051513]|uniref:hypothetical protein n=1 Tax=Actinoplanes sp. NPDC051513 TaxID=3363908 RepID=UPI0037B43CF4